MSFGFGKTESNDSAAKNIADFQIGPKQGNATSTSNQEVYIGSGTTLDGNFVFEGPTYINCRINGDIKAKNILKIGPEAEIRGEIEATEVTLSGKLEGNLIASKSISLEKPAEMKGDIRAPKVSISEGVIFNGQCSMKSPGEIVDLKIGNSPKF